MNKNDFIKTFPGFFVSEIYGEMLWLKFSGNFFHNIISFENRDFILDYLENISQEPNIKSIVINFSYNLAVIFILIRFSIYDSGSML